MASLNTLRTKGGWFLTAIILIALLAFILGDIGPGTGGKDPVVAEINGVKIKYSEFSQEMHTQDNLIRMMGGGTDTGDQAFDAAWMELIMRHSFIPGFTFLGLNNSEREQIDMTSGVFLSPVIMSYFRNPETGMFDMQMLRFFIENMGWEQQMMWSFIQKQMNDERMMSKFGVLAANGLKVNDIDVRSGVNAENNAFDARVIFVPYTSVDDEAVSVTDAQVREYYANHKSRFRRTASRGIEYVVFDIIPSADDMAAGYRHAEDLAARFAAAENPAAFAALNSEDRTPARFAREAEVETSVAAALLGGQPEAFYGPVLRGEMFTMSRLAESRMIPDSVRFSIIVLLDNAPADSLMRVVNAGNFAQLARQHSEDIQTALDGGDVGTVDPLVFEQQHPAIMEALISTPRGQIVRVAEGGATFLVHVTERSAPVRKVRIATVQYTVRPSSVTHAAAMNRAREFYNNARSGQEAFNAAVTDMALPRRVARIESGDRNVSGIENSRQLVRWAFGEKRGAVSEPQEFGDFVIVASLTDIVEDGIAPIEAVTPEIRTLLRQRAKGDMIAQQMTAAGGSIDAIAAARALEIQEVEGLAFSSFGLPGIGGMEPRLVGAITAATQVGRLSAPVQGNMGVYMFEVTNITHEENTTEIDQRLRLESVAQYFLNESIMRALYDRSNVRDFRMRYF
ncbi:MAG: SurA N-terminal domain-containing protein [Rikenellaceae bacterium]|nr:SurA N-terminal domain-containing protein [Rikenellaceae bacterium]MCL2692164.1 SurA N-terminal domain-containing protein [Rikenellaceae bacterium]